MSERTLTFDYRHYPTPEALPATDRQLVARAREACANAHAPYSGFRVGAAALLDDGQTVSASNQESEVFPSGMCAERSLLYYVQGNYPGRKVTAIAIVSQPGERECYPCGACRQVLVDVEKRQGAPLRVVMCSDHSATVVDWAQLLLPFTFEL